MSRPKLKVKQSKVITFKTFPDYYWRLREEARNRQLTLSGLIKKALEEFINQKQKGE